MVTVTHDNLWLCHDCHFAASGVDDTIVEQRQAKATENGLARLAELGNLAPDYDCHSGSGTEEFSSRRCSCCGPALAGSRHRYAILGESEAK